VIDQFTTLLGYCIRLAARNSAIAAPAIQDHAARIHYRIQDSGQRTGRPGHRVRTGLFEFQMCACHSPKYELAPLQVHD